MENTAPLLFDNIDEKYFVAINGRAVGPLTAHEVYERIRKAEIGILNFFWREGWNDWKRVCDDRDFSVLVPQKPSSASIDQIREKLLHKRRSQPTVAQPEPKTYYLYFNSSQYGPFSKQELEHVLKSQKLGRSAYVWMPGWPNWKRISEVPEFATLLPKAAPAAAKDERRATRRKGKTGRTDRTERTKTGISRTKLSAVNQDENTMGIRVGANAGVDASDKRRAPRRPLVARLFLHNDKDVIIAVCRDISVGGMQVLTDRVPGPVGSVIKLNVSPGDPNKVKSFVAEGEIVRILEDGRGFSFRFKRITDEARRAIEKYIRQD